MHRATLLTFLLLFFPIAFITTAFGSFQVQKLAFSHVPGATCESPKHSASGYSTQDGFFHYQTSFVVEFALQCSNNYQQNGQFYAVVNGRSYQVAVSEETAKYQVSWQLEHPESGSQTFDVHVYDEDKFAEYKKAVDSGSDPSSAASPLFTYQYYHPGVSKKAPVSSESVCLLLGAAAVYYALHFKQQLAKRD